MRAVKGRNINFAIEIRPALKLEKSNSPTNQSAISVTICLSGLNIEKLSIEAATSSSSKPKNPAIFLMIHLIPSSNIIPRSMNPPKNPTNAAFNPPSILSKRFPSVSTNPE